MGQHRFTPEQIIAKLREVEVLVARGATAVEACRQIGIAQRALYRWRKEYGGPAVFLASTARRSAGWRRTMPTSSG